MYLIYFSLPVSVSYFSNLLFLLLLPWLLTKTGKRKSRGRWEEAYASATESKRRDTCYVTRLAVYFGVFGQETVSLGSRQDNGNLLQGQTSVPSSSSLFPSRQLTGPLTRLAVACLGGGLPPLFCDGNVNLEKKGIPVIIFSSLSPMVWPWFT